MATALHYRLGTELYDDNKVLNYYLWDLLSAVQDRKDMKLSGNP